MKYLLVCFLLVISCKPAIRDAGNADVVIGITSNTKAGAIVSNDSGLYLIAGLHSWDSICLGKKVKVKGNFTFIEDYYKNREKSGNAFINSLQAQVFNGNYYSVSDAAWELYNAD